MFVVRDFLQTNNNIFMTHCNNKSCNKWCYYTKCGSTKKKEWLSSQKKIIDEDIFCIEYAPIEPPKPSSSSKIEKAHTNQPKLRSSSEIEKCKSLSSISYPKYA